MFSFVRGNHRRRAATFKFRTPDDVDQLVAAATGADPASVVPTLEALIRNTHVREIDDRDRQAFQEEYDRLLEAGEQPGQFPWTTTPPPPDLPRNLAAMRWFERRCSAVEQRVLEHLDAYGASGPAQRQQVDDLALRILDGIRRPLLEAYYVKIFDALSSGLRNITAHVDVIAARRAIGGRASETVSRDPLAAGNLLAAYKKAISDFLDEQGAKWEYMKPFVEADLARVERDPRWDEAALGAASDAIKKRNDLDVPYTLGLVALLCSEPSKPEVPDDAFWSFPVFWGDELSGRRLFFLRRLHPTQTRRLMARGTGLSQGYGWEFARFVALADADFAPHLAALLETDVQEARRRVVSAIRGGVSHWEPKAPILFALTEAIEEMLGALGTGRLARTDMRPTVWRLAGTVVALGCVAEAMGKESGKPGSGWTNAGDPDVGERLVPIAFADRLIAIEEALEERWPDPPDWPPGHDGLSSSPIVGWGDTSLGQWVDADWSPFVSIPDVCHYNHPAQIISNRALEPPRKAR